MLKMERDSALVTATQRAVRRHVAIAARPEQALSRGLEQHHRSEFRRKNE